MAELDDHRSLDCQERTALFFALVAPSGAFGLHSVVERRKPGLPAHALPLGDGAVEGSGSAKGH